MSILLTVSVTLFSILGVFIMSTKQGDRLANVLLGMFFLLWGFDLLDGLLMLNGFYLQHPQLALWSEASIFLYGPLLYFYTLRVLKGGSLPTWSTILHLSPFLCSVFTLAVTFHLQSKAKQVEILTQILTLQQSPSMYLMVFVVCIHFSAYILLSKKAVNTRDQELRTYHSNYNLTWLSSVLNAVLIIFLTSILANVIQLSRSSLYFELALPVLSILITFFILKIFWQSLREPFVWLNEVPMYKYESSTIDVSKKSTIAADIIRALEVDKVFLEPDLTLADLAEKVDHPTRAVSQVINEVINKSFFNLINSYRVEEAKSRFINRSDSKLTVAEVMYQVGFNSKSSFNTQFKKHTGLTPTAFIKTI